MTFNIIATEGYAHGTMPLEVADWEHVSVSGRRIPNWQEMCFVRDLFWDKSVWVLQFHPPQSEYINYHPKCLHLFRYKGHFPTPPSILVGPRKSTQPTIGVQNAGSDYPAASSQPE